MNSKTSNIYPWVVVGLLWGVALLNYMDRQMLSTMRIPMMEDVRELESAANFGRLMAVFLWVYGLMSPLSGIIGDRVNRKWLIVGSLCVWSGVTYLMGYATTFNQLYWLRGIMGISEALYLPAALSLIADFHKDKTRSLAVGIHMTGLYVGQAIGGFGATFAAIYSWHTTFHWFGIIGVGYGIILAFLDFLTYPPVAFVVPLCFVLVFSEQDLLHNLLASIRYGIAFLLGYAGMWVSKWILASLFTDENVIAEGIESVLHRTGKGAMSDVDSAFNVEISPAAAMRENLHAFGTRPVRIMVFLLLCAAVVLVIYMIRHKAGFTKRAAGMFVIFALLTIIPIVWIVALNNHCSLHPHLEWREWLVAVFAPLMWLAWFWTDRRKKAVECR